MSLENAIKGLLEERRASSSNESLEESNLKPGAGAKESKPMKQGSSKEAGWEALTQNEHGKSAAAKMSETSKKPAGKGTGDAKGDWKQTGKDARQVVNQPSSKGNVFQESIAKMFEGDKTITEEAKTKMTGLFEALVDARVSELREEIEAEAAEAAVAAIEEKEAELTEQVDKYLDYIAEQWLEDHAAAVESALKAEMAESFFQGLRNLFAEHYITFPEGGTDVVQTLEAENAELKGELNATIEAGVEVEEELTALKKQAIIAEAAEGLALTEQEKLTTLCADAIFEDEESFSKKVAVIRESYFAKGSAKKVALTEEKGTETLVETDDEGSKDEVSADPAIAGVVAALNRNARL